MRAPFPGLQNQDESALAIYRAEMTEANDLAKSDIAAAVEKMMLAVGHLNDAIGIQKGAALCVREMLADLPLGKRHAWATPARIGTRLTAGPERDRRAKAVALVTVFREMDGLTLVEAAARVAKVLPEPVRGSTVEGWCEEVERWCPPDDPDYFPALVEILRPLDPETALAVVADAFTQAR